MSLEAEIAIFISGLALGVALLAVLYCRALHQQAEKREKAVNQKLNAALGLAWAARISGGNIGCES